MEVELRQMTNSLFSTYSFLHPLFHLSFLSFFLLLLLHLTCSGWMLILQMFVFFSLSLPPSHFFHCWHSSILSALLPVQLTSQQQQQHYHRGPLLMPGPVCFVPTIGGQREGRRDGDQAFTWKGLYWQYHGCVHVCVCEIVLGGNEGHIWDRELALVNQSERANILSWAPGTGSTRRGINTHICECIHTQSPMKKMIVGLKVFGFSYIYTI